MKIFGDGNDDMFDGVSLNVPLVPDVPAVAGNGDTLVEPSPPPAKNKNKKHKSWNYHFCNSSTCEWVTIISL